MALMPFLVADFHSIPHTAILSFTTWCVLFAAGYVYFGATNFPSKKFQRAMLANRVSAYGHAVSSTCLCWYTIYATGILYSPASASYLNFGLPMAGHDLFVVAIDWTVGFFVWDFLYMLFPTPDRDATYLAHHIGGLLVLVPPRIYGSGCVVGILCIACGEISNPFQLPFYAGLIFSKDPEKSAADRKWWTEFQDKFSPPFTYIFTFFRCVFGPPVFCMHAVAALRGDTGVSPPNPFGVLQAVAAYAVIGISQLWAKSTWEGYIKRRATLGLGAWPLSVASAAASAARMRAAAAAKKAKAAVPSRSKSPSRPKEK